MPRDELKIIIDKGWENRENIDSNTKGEIKEAVETTLHALDSGTLRVAEKNSNKSWEVNEWAKKSSPAQF
jgi:2,3,4,5-tetrahydropyridine-2-carboxylate N-succinyltransferase